VAQSYVDLPAVLWRHRLLLLCATLIGGGAAAIGSLAATPVYKAGVVMTQTEDRDAAKRVQAASGTATALAAIADIDPLGDLTADSRFQQFLKSQRLAEEFIKRENISAELFPRLNHPVSIWFAARRFRERVRYVEENKLKGTTAVSMEWTDPVRAAQWANSYVALANELIRAEDSQTARRRIEYLRAQAAGTSDVTLQRALYQNLTQEAEKSMFADGKAEYAFTVVDPAMVPEERVRPPRRLMTSLGAATGLLGTIAAVFARYALGRPRDGAASSAGGVSAYAE
jgi:uncharacterized protein involved in exopolysaccharide biosynthesis